jgi:hypothetical protein
MPIVKNDVMNDIGRKMIVTMVKIMADLPVRATPVACSRARRASKGFACC